MRWDRILELLPVRVTGLGWSVAGLGLLGAVAGLWLDWQEARIIALACFFVLVFSARYLLGRAEFDVELHAEPERAKRGDPARVSILLRNKGKHRLLPGVVVEVPISMGDRVIAQHHDRLPMLATGDRYPVNFEVPTQRRGVLVLGPVRSVRADPLGLMRREMSWTKPVELIVHPDTAVVGRLGAGLLRDLEGQSTNDRSVSDIAFHSLRDYVQGDDMRHVHALTSMKLQKLVVRQFVDTRTARLAVVVSGARHEYRDEEDFELALSAGGSFAQRGIDDGQKVSVLAAGHHTPARHRQSRQLVLDGFSRAEFGTGFDLVTASARMSRTAPDTSIAVLITGSLVDNAGLRSAAARFSPDVRVIIVLADSQQPKSVTRARHRMIVGLPELAQLQGFNQQRSNR
jgi:uncharacterized protein (DUF58 family)